MRLLSLIFLGTMLMSAMTVRAQEDLDQSDHFDGIEGTFVLYDPQTDTTIRYNEERAAQRFSPFSTYKVPHALIGLDSGVLSGPEHEIIWNSEKYPRQGWWSEEPFQNWDEDQTLATALRDSVVWYFRELAKMLGPERTQEYLDALDYGNRDISSGIDGYWLNRSLQISADEEVDFLWRMLNGELDIAPEAVQTVKDIIQQEETDTYRFYGKTGGGYINEVSGLYLGWFMGFVERGEDVYVFALHIEGSDALSSQRIACTRAILADMGLRD